MAEGDNWKAKALLLGVVLGALTGLGAAYLIVRRAEDSQTRPRLTAGLGMRVGTLVLGLLREVAQLGEGRS